MHTTIQLPYMGKPVEPELKTKADRLRAVEIPMADLHDHEMRNISMHDDPADVLIAKVEHLAQLLGCSEQKAERLLFARLAA